MKLFEKGRITCVNTDWSKEGITFPLLQKPCKCEGFNLRGCKDSWKLCYTSSRFWTGAESPSFLQAGGGASLLS